MIDMHVRHSWQLDAESVRALASSCIPIRLRRSDRKATPTVGLFISMDYGSTRWRPCSIATSANRVSGSRTVYGAGESPEAMIGFLHFGLM